MVITIRDREIAEAAWDEAASLLQGDYDDDNASHYLFEMNPHREPGTFYCESCGVVRRFRPCEVQGESHA